MRKLHCRHAIPGARLIPAFGQLLVLGRQSASSSLIGICLSLSNTIQAALQYYRANNYLSAVRYVAFLRGINLGNRRLPMSKLRTLCEELGFSEVETFIASGNIIFSSALSSGSSLEAQISSHLEKSLSYPVETFVRTMAEVTKIPDRKVFTDENDLAVKVHVAFLKTKLPASMARALQAIETGYDEFKVDGREFYWLTRGPISESKVWTLPEVKQIKLPSCTMRNMTSIRKLVAKHA